MNIKTNQLENIILTHALINQPVFVFGRPGIGKTQEIARIGRECFGKYLHMDGSQMPYEAIQGINFVAAGEMRNTPYPVIKELEDIALSGTAPENGVFVFIDEVSSLAQDDQRTLLNIINDRVTPNGIKLDFDIMFVLAGNPAADQRGFANANADAAVNLVEQAIVTRCATYVVSYSVRDYIMYGEKVGIHPSIISVLKEVPEVFDRYNDDSVDSVQVITPRTLSMLSDLLWMALDKGREVTESMIAAFVGLDAPLFYDAFLKAKEIHVDFEKLMNGDKESVKLFDSMNVTARGAVVIRGIRSACMSNVDLREAEKDARLADILLQLSPEYSFTISQMMLHKEFSNFFLGTKTNQTLASIIQTARS